MTQRSRLGGLAVIEDILEARLALETMLMARLCGQVRPEHAMRARQLAGALATASLEDQGRSLIEADAAFHCQLYAAAGNLIAAEMLQRGWSDLLRLWSDRRPPHATTMDWVACRARRVREHDTLLTALLEGDTLMVQAATIQHIESDRLELKSLQSAQ